MSSFFDQINAFLIQNCSKTSPLLLALSGGPDSLSLFYALLYFRKQNGITFHVAHVDHGWRQESQHEVHSLHQLATQYEVPFHLKVLNPRHLEGNLEAACREERYAFFAQLCREIPFQGVLTGHHQGDQAETIFKRIMEGAHWSRWSCLKPENKVKGIRILRPLLTMTKKDIQKMLSDVPFQAFDDSTNRNTQFLRARLRESVFPRLNEEFGKEIQNSLITLGLDAQELIDYFDMRLASILNQAVEGPWGLCLDLQQLLPSSLLEIKYLLRILTKDKDFFLSRTILDQASKALQLGKANQHFAMGPHHIWIDRKRIFIISSHFIHKENHILTISKENELIGPWKIKMTEEIFSGDSKFSSWKEAWQGRLQCYLPKGNYKIGLVPELNSKDHVIKTSIKKRWNQAKIPAFLYHHFPLIWEDQKVYHEFLTGKPFIELKEGISCYKIDLNYSK